MTILMVKVNFTGEGEWMLVFNEIKLYRDEQVDAELLMIKDNYMARVYSPVEGDVNYGMLSLVTTMAVRTLTVLLVRR